MKKNVWLFDKDKTLWLVPCHLEYPTPKRKKSANLQQTLSDLKEGHRNLKSKQMKML